MIVSEELLTNFPDQNLYVGTSASEILHFVQIPPDPGDPTGKPSYILASRLPPAYHEPPTPARPGVQQILLLPRVNKACILCNWTVTFYSLPELSPGFGTTQIRPCNWIGGTDLNIENGSEEEGKAPSVTVLASLNRKIRVIKISEAARALRVCPIMIYSIFIANVTRRLTSQEVLSQCAGTPSLVLRMRGRMLC